MNAADLRVRASQGILEDDMTLAELFELWLKIEKAPRLKPQSMKTLRTQVRQANRVLGQIKIKDLKRTHIDLAQSYFMDADKITSYNRMLVNLRSALKFAIDRGLLTRNVAQSAKPLPNVNKIVRDPFSPMELKMIENADLSPMERCAVDLLRYSGIRRGELLALRPADITDSVSISKHYVSQTNVIEPGAKTAAGVRTIPLPDIFFQRNAEYLNSLMPTQLIIHSKQNTPLMTSNFGVMWKRISAKIYDVKPDNFTPHRFRHNYATELYRAGMDVKTMQYLLGHDDIKTTLNLYTHFSKDDIDKEAVERYFRMVGQKSVNTSTDLQKMA